MPRSILALTSLGVAATLTAQQQLLVPFNHHLGAAIGHTNGSSALFRSTAGRFVVIFEASNFAASGVIGPITIEKLRFRGEDTESNRGLQVYANPTVRIGSTSLTTSTLSGTYASNWAPALPDTTTSVGPFTIPTLIVAPSLGTSPNNYHIEIDLTALGGTFTYDPASAEPNLLVEIVMPNPPTFTIGSALGLIGTQATVGTSTQLGTACRTSPNATNATGFATNSPVMNIEFTGSGGYATLVPARVDNYGAGCGGSGSGFYQLWKHTQHFDLAGTTLVITPDNPLAPTSYTVSAGSSSPDLTKLNSAPNSTADDVTLTLALGYPFRFVGGSTTQVQVSTNGYFFLGFPGASALAETYKPTLAKWLGSGTNEPTRFAPIWHDWDCSLNQLTHPNSGLHLFNDISGGAGNIVTYLTWFNVSRRNVQMVPGFSTASAVHSVNTFQAVLYEATGIVEFRYGTMTELNGAATALSENVGITGFTRGNIAGTPSVDVQSRDLSVELPFTTGAETGNHVGLVAVQAASVPTGLPGRLFPGASVTWNATNLPAGTLLGGLFLDFAPLAPGLNLPGIIAPGCLISLTPNAFSWELFVTPPTTATGTTALTIPTGYNPGLLGAQLYAQFLVLDGLFGGPNLITGSSTALKHTVGLQ